MFGMWVRRVSERTEHIITAGLLMCLLSTVSIIGSRLAEMLLSVPLRKYPLRRLREGMW